MKEIHQIPIVRVLVGGIATGLAALFGFLLVGYVLLGGGSFEAVTAAFVISLVAGILAVHEYRAFGNCG